MVNITRGITHTIRSPSRVIAELGSNARNLSRVRASAPLMLGSASMLASPFRLVRVAGPLVVLVLDDRYCQHDFSRMRLDCSDELQNPRSRARIVRKASECLPNLCAAVEPTAVPHFQLGSWANPGIPISAEIPNAQTTCSAPSDGRNLPRKKSRDSRRPVRTRVSVRSGGCC